MRKRIYILGLLIVLLLPKSVMAASGNIYLNCTPSTVNAGSEVSCVVTGRADFAVGTILIPVTLDSNLTAKAFNFPDGSDFFGDLSDNVIRISTTNDISNNFTLGTLKVSVGSTAAAGPRTIAFNGVTFIPFATSSGVSIDGTSATITVNAPEPIKSTLKSMSVSSSVGALSPQFSSTGYSYTLLLEPNTSSFRLSVSATNSGDPIVVKNDMGETLDASSISFTPSSGQDSMQLRVTVGSGESASTYIINVGRKEEQGSTSGNPYLSSLTLGGKTVNLKNQSTADEEITVTLNTVSSYQLRATLSDSTNYDFSTASLPSSCSASNGTLTCNLSGETRIAIMVVPKSGSGASKNYILSVKKGSGGGSSGGSSSSNDSIYTNPQTGGTAYVMAAVLILSLVGTLYLYKRNIKEFQ